jgi:5-formyltetrahydrofolate cyclo-ligase
MTKSELRSIYLEKRRDLTPEDTSRKSESIVERLFAEIDFTSVRILHSFISIPSKAEVDTTFIFERLWQDLSLIKTCAPVMNEATGAIDAIEYTSSTSVRPNTWGINEPVDSEVVDPAAIDLVIVPLLCFDKLGHRVGYGKGYYDRFLKKCRPDCIKAGVSYFLPVDKIDDVHDGDIPLDVCFTPDETYRFERTI